MSLAPDVKLEPRSRELPQPCTLSCVCGLNVRGAAREDGPLDTGTRISVQQGREGLEAEAWWPGWICPWWQEFAMPLVPILVDHREAGLCLEEGQG